MIMATYNKLLSAGFEPQQQLESRKTVVTQEQGKKYTLAIKNQCPSAVFQVDGYIVKSGRKCDKLVLVNTDSPSQNEWTEIFVELKGKDAVHGMEQLLSSAKEQIFADPTNKSRRARLVATSIPANTANPMAERIRREFAKLKIDYKNLKPGQIDNL